MTPDKYNSRLGRVNGARALIVFPSHLFSDEPNPQTTMFARIADGYQLIETPTDYVGVLNEQTGDSRNLEWEMVPENAKVGIDVVTTLL